MGVAPGWYPDPAGGTGQRFFDGTNWTDQTAPHPSYFSPPAQPGSLQSTRKSGASKGILTLVGIIVAVVALVSMCTSGSNSASSNKEDSSPSSQSASGGAASEGATLGDEVRDGKFAFVVNSVAPSDSAFGGNPPRGKWIIADVTVTNIGNEPQSFFVQNQKLFDAQGREYAADSTASMDMNEEGSMIFDLNPGFQTKLSLPFDVPTNVTPKKLELHDSMFSGGTTVTVG